MTHIDRSRPTLGAYCEVGRRVAVEWGVAATEVTLLNQSENVVLRVGRDGEPPVVMRLHRPGYNTLAELESEVAWVVSLREAGVPVPTPVEMQGGGHYLEAEIGAPDGSCETRHVGVVEWLDGTPIRGLHEQTGQSAAPWFRDLGALMARLRLHSQSWNPPSGFVRRRWDSDGFVGEVPVWGRFWQVDAATREQRAVLIEGRDALRERLGALSTGPDRFGLIHADLHLGNVMLARPKAQDTADPVGPAEAGVGAADASTNPLTLIDFDDAGFGWFAHELAVALESIMDEPWYDEARRELVAGYRSIFAIEDSELELVDLFQAVRATMLVSWLDARPELGGRDDLEELITSAVTECRKVIG